MGVSTNAILFFGFTFSGEDEILGEATEEQKEALQAKLNEEDDYFYDICKNNPNVGVDYHCHSEFPMHYVYHKAFHLVAHRGYEEVVDLGRMTGMVAMQAQLKAFCEEHGIPWQQPRWTLASYWG